VDIPPKKQWETSDGMVKAFKKESQRQKALIRKAKICDAHLMFIMTAFRQLANDEDFTNLLRAERLDSMPKFLADKIGLERSVA
jgi:ParB family chromosome partitioning protein